MLRRVSTLQCQAEGAKPSFLVPSAGLLSPRAILVREAIPIAGMSPVQRGRIWPEFSRFCRRAE